MEKAESGAKPRRILFFFPYNPYPPRSGAQVRCLKILLGLLELNCEVFFLSLSNFSENTWNAESVEFLKKAGVKKIEIYRATLVDSMMSALIRRMYLCINQLPPADSLKYTPFGMRTWFKKMQSHYNPDIIWMNYSYYDPLISCEGEKKPTRVIDYHDLISLNLKLNHEVKKGFFGRPYTLQNSEFLREDFFDTHKCYTDEIELQVITRFDKIVAISEPEAELLKKFNPEADVTHIPVTSAPVHCSNSYAGPAIFTTGPNIFNLQGLFYFTDRVLPEILRSCPDFHLTVTGACSDKIRPVNSVSLAGYVDELKSHYCCARFAIGPVLGGTGQQIKIIEAMAHGLPVVVTSYSAKTSPIVHGVNGFIANNAEEFALYCSQLWLDSNLCQKMGDSARTTIATDYSEDLLLQKLSQVMN